jgi:hypothetical protein
MGRSTMGDHLQVRFSMAFTPTRESASLTFRRLRGYQL